MSVLRLKRLLSLNATVRRRAATAAGAVAIGLSAYAFASAADRAQNLFMGFARAWPLAPLLMTPLGFLGLAALTRRYAPATRGSGIPQVIAAAETPRHGVSAHLISVATAVWKTVLTVAALLVGASVGREGPTVQISAAVMAACHRIARVKLSPSIIIAGGAAGVSAAFNTPLAGIAFAIEELAAAYEQRLVIVAMAAVMISGFITQGLAGDYIYFGAMHRSLSLNAVLLAVPVAGVLGGLSGALFSRAVQFVALSPAAAALRRRPLVLALVCGVVVAGIGCLTGGATWGTGYDAAKRMVESHQEALWFGPAKFVATLCTTASGLAGGIFAPSLAVGAGIGNLISLLFPAEPSGAIVVLGMIAYFVGVVRAPLTGVIIVSEMTDSRAMLLPLFAAALLADGVSVLVCRDRLYHGLAKAFRAA